MSPQEYPSYITKDIAAQRLNVSARRALELVVEKGIRTAETYNAETKRRQTVLCAEDVERLVAERQPGALGMVRAQAALPPPASAPEPAAPVPGPLVDYPAHAWLTVSEAAAYTRLPAASILALIRSRNLKALNVGVREGGQYRVKRTDLDAIAGELLDVL